MKKNSKKNIKQHLKKENSRFYDKIEHNTTNFCPGLNKKRQYR